MTATEQNLRIIYRIGANGVETRVRMEALKKGDLFRIKTEDPKDHLYGKEMVKYRAHSDARLIGTAWGLDVIEEES